jgi:peptidoglycan/LPS O-acetylase OafA/YrhL
LLIPSDPLAFRQNNFDAIRLLMALAVVWSHSFAIFKGSEDSEPLSLVLRGTYNAGNLAVLVFFTISGFLICRSYEQSKSVARYFENRVRRIYPGYLVAVAVGAFLIIPLYSSRSLTSFTLQEVVGVFGLNALRRNYVPASDVFGGNPINGSLWSIPFEFWCYIGLAGLGLSGFLTRRFVCLAIIAVVMVLRVWLDLTGRKPGGGIVGQIIGWPYLWFVVLPCFLTGVAFYQWRSVIPKSRMLLIGALVAFLAAANSPLELLHAKIHTNLLLPVTIGYATFYAAFTGRWLGTITSVGDFSYGTYLYAFPIQQMLFASLGTTLAFPLLVALAMVLAPAAGVASWFLVERLFLSSSNHNQHTRRQAASILRASMFWAVPRSALGLRESRKTPPDPLGRPT